MCKCDSKKARFIKEREAITLISMLRIKTALSESPIAGPLLF